MSVNPKTGNGKLVKQEAKDHRYRNIGEMER